MEEAFHQSTIKSYLSCPRSFRYQYLEGIQSPWRSSATVHGTVLHCMIERLHAWENRGRKIGDRRILIACYTYSFFFAIPLGFRWATNGILLKTAACHFLQFL